MPRHMLMRLLPLLALVGAGLLLILSTEGSSEAAGIVLVVAAVIVAVTLSDPTNGRRV